MPSKSKPKKRCWLITSFEPFAGRLVNNSNLVLEEIKKAENEMGTDPTWDFQFYYFVLPVEYDRCFISLKEELARLAKSKIEIEGILSLGEGSEEFKLETQGNNLDDVAELADSVGVKRIGKKIFPDLDANAIIPLRFPFQAFSRIRASTNAGHYICNHLCARAGREFGADVNAPSFGFIHVPRAGLGGMFSPDICAAVIVNSFKKI